MPKQDKENVVFAAARSTLSAARNSIRFNFAGRPAPKRQRLGKLARLGLSTAVRSELKIKSKDWIKYATKKGGATGNFAATKIRVKAQPLLNNKPTATASFVGIGLDEHVQTRLQKTGAHWKNPTQGEAHDIFNSRSRTADLVWATKGNPEPISGHTPGIKHRPVPGTTAAITVEHGTRDNLRSAANSKTLSDMNSPTPFTDLSVMSALATVKYMASPSTQLEGAKAAVAALPTPRYSALTGNNDIRNPVHFENMVNHVQEERERKKWEVASVMYSNQRLSPLVPPTINNYLGTNENNPLKAMESFRRDQHKGWFAPPINTSRKSDTKDLTKHSLHELVTKTNTTGRRARALSDARALPAISPINGRGTT